MLKKFGMRPDEVNDLDKEMVYKFLWLEEKWKQKQQEEYKKKT